MGLTSKIYQSNQILFESGSRKGKTKKQLAKMIKAKQKYKKTQPFADAKGRILRSY
jgi:hypothetical protein